MQFPDGFIDSLQGSAGFTEADFIQVHAAAATVSVRVNNAKYTDRFADFEKVPWCKNAFYLGERPKFTLDPLFHAGTYYVQEASSMFLDHVLRNTLDLSKALKVLDLCAAPGGKSTLIASAISTDSLLVSNEVIRSRVHILKENIIKWGNANVIVTNNDPVDFKKVKKYFDVVVVDAPCSGSGLFRKDFTAMQEWSEENVLLCSKRQHRILADVIPSLKQDGILIYATCSYSKKEDEDIVEMLINEYGFELLQIPVNGRWGIVQSDYGFRFYPDKIKGEGFFMSALRNKNADLQEEYVPENSLTKKLPLEKITENEKLTMAAWLNTEHRFEIRKRQNNYYAFPETIAADMQYLFSVLTGVNAGIYCGELKGKDFIPAHALALSHIMNKNIPALPVDRETALQYLRKLEIPTTLAKAAGANKGWNLLQYDNINLGWIKVLDNRINNYYPTEWRIKNL